MTKSLRLILAMVLALLGITVAAAPAMAVEPAPAAVTISAPADLVVASPSAFQVQPSVVLCGISYYDYKVVTAYKTKYFYFYWEAQRYRDSLWDPWKMYKYGQFDSNDGDCGEWVVVAYEN